MPDARKIVFKSVAHTDPQPRLKKHLAHVRDRFGLNALINELTELAAEYVASTKRKEGRPPLSKNQKMHVWMAIELESYFRNIESIDATVKAVFGEIHRVPKLWYIDVGNDLRGFPKSVRRWHTEAKSLMKDDPKLDARWHSKLEYVKKAKQKIKDDKWTAKRVGDRLNIYVDGVLVRSIRIKETGGDPTAPAR